MGKKYCRGTSKAKGHGCGKELDFVIGQNGIKSYKAKYGLGYSCGCFAKWLYTSTEGEEILHKSMTVAKRKVEKEKKAEIRRKKDELVDYKKKLQSKINQIARLIDYGLPCLAKGTYPNQMHGGHVFSRGAFPSMRYNLHNIHRQSAQSNHFQNEDGLFRDELKKEYGEGYYNFLVECKKTKPLKYTNEEYKEFYKKACDISNNLSKSKIKLSLKNRVLLRNKINLQLGIYDNFCTFKV